MKMNAMFLRCAVVAVVLAVAAATQAQQVTGELGSPPRATTTGGKQLPLPEPKFGGVIKTKASASKPWWAPRVVPLKGAPRSIRRHVKPVQDCELG